MALKRPNDMLATFSMASMTDVVFLLLVFFMVTSAFVFPTALEIDLPNGSEQTPVKPAHRVYVDSLGGYYVADGDAAPAPIASDSLAVWIGSLSADSVATVAVYGDSAVDYGKVVDVLNAGAASGVRMVLATRPASAADFQPRSSAR